MVCLDFTLVICLVELEILKQCYLCPELLSLPLSWPCRCLFVLGQGLSAFDSLGTHYGNQANLELSELLLPLPPKH